MTGEKQENRFKGDRDPRTHVAYTVLEQLTERGLRATGSEMFIHSPFLYSTATLCPAWLGAVLYSGDQNRGGLAPSFISDGKTGFKPLTKVCNCQLQ